MVTWVGCQVPSKISIVQSKITMFPYIRCENTCIRAPSKRKIPALYSFWSADSPIRWAVCPHLGSNLFISDLFGGRIFSPIRFDSYYIEIMSMQRAKPDFQTISNWAILWPNRKRLFVKHNNVAASRMKSARRFHSKVMMQGCNPKLYDFTVECTDLKKL